MTVPTQAKAPRTDTRERILHVAAQLFAAKGFAGTSVRDLAEELQVTKAALYYHFESKEEILRALLAEPVAAVVDALGGPRDLGTPEARKTFVIDVILALSSCDRDAVKVFKDPNVVPILDEQVSMSGVTTQLAERLAMGLSGTDDPAQMRPEHLMRAIAAVGAGYEAINTWHVVYPECEKWDPADVEVIAGYVSDVLEGGTRSTQ